MLKGDQFKIIFQRAHDEALLFCKTLLLLQSAYFYLKVMKMSTNKKTLAPNNFSFSRTTGFWR